MVRDVVVSRQVPWWRRGLRSQDWPGWGAIIGSESGLPVYDVRVFCVPVDSAAVWTWRHGERFLGQVDVVPPGEQRIEIPGDIKAVEEAGGSVPTWLVVIEFTDANGAKWLRDPRGES